MKIAILTQPLHDNYGGLFQAYALKKVLKDLRHEVIIINICLELYNYPQILDNNNN